VQTAQCNCAWNISNWNTNNWNIIK